MSMEEKSNRRRTVYNFLADKVNGINEQLYQEWKNDSTNLTTCNKGARCFMKKTDIFKNETLLQEAKNAMHLKSVVNIKVSNQELVDTVLTYKQDGSTMGVMYTPHCSPYNTISTGSPGELTDLACRSTLLWHLKSTPFLLSQPKGEENPKPSKYTKYCKLFAGTSFRVPNIEVRSSSIKDGWEEYPTPNTIDLTMMSSVEYVLNFWEKEDRVNIKIGNLIYLKLITPLRMALQQNMRRQHMEYPEVPLIRRIVIGDMDIRSSEIGINSLFCQTLLRIINTYKNCFEEVVICINSPSTRNHLLSLLKMQDSE